MANDIMQDVNMTANAINVALHMAQLAPKAVEEVLKSFDTIAKNVNEASFNKQSAKALQKAFMEGDKPYIYIENDDVKREAMRRALIRQGIQFGEINIPGYGKGFIYAEKDYNKVNDLDKEINKDDIDNTQEVPFEDLASEPVNEQHSTKEDIQIIKDILDADKVPYSVDQDNKIYYHQKDENKVKLANEISALQKKSPEVIKYLKLKEENLKRNTKTYLALCGVEGEPPKNKDIGLFDKEGNGVVFDGNKVYVIGRENGQNTISIFNKNEFSQNENLLYTDFLVKATRDQNLVILEKDGLVDSLKKDGASNEILNSLKEMHKEKMEEIYKFSKEEEEKLKEVCKWTTVYVYNEHPDGSVTTELLRRTPAAQACFTTSTVPDLDGKNDGQCPTELKEEVKNEVEEIKIKTLTKEEIINITEFKSIVEEINTKESTISESIDLNLSNEQTDIKIGEQ